MKKWTHCAAAALTVLSLTMGSAAAEDVEEEIAEEAEIAEETETAEETEIAEATETAEEAEDASQWETEPTEGAPLTRASCVDPTLQVHPVSYVMEDIFMEDEKSVLLKGAYSSLDVSFPEGTPQPVVCAAVSSYEYNQRDSYRERNHKLAKEAVAGRNTLPGTFYGYRNDLGVLLRRADSLAVSYIQTSSSYTGGVHGMYGYSGINFDGTSGRPLTAADVFANTEMLTAALIEQLRSWYPDTPFIDMEKGVENRVKEGTLNFTLDPRGVTFYFNPYEIASYADGMLQVYIGYDQQPELFKPEYSRGPANYCAVLELDTVFTGDIREQGSVDQLRIFLHNNAVHVELNGVSHDMPANVERERMHPVLLHLQDGRSYLYLDCGRKNAQAREIHVYSLTGEAPEYLGSLPLTFCTDKTEDGGLRMAEPTDPLDFVLTYGATFRTPGHYRVGADGMPEKIW